MAALWCNKTQQQRFFVGLAVMLTALALQPQLVWAQASAGFEAPSGQDLAIQESEQLAARGEYPKAQAQISSYLARHPQLAPEQKISLQLAGARYAQATHDLAQGLQWVQQALEAARTARLAPEQGQALLQQGLLYRDSGRYPQAQAAFLQAHQIFEQVAATYQQAPNASSRSLLEIAKLLCLQGDYLGAHAKLADALGYLDDANSAQLMSEIYLTQARIGALNGNWQTPHYQWAIDAARRIGHPELEVTALLDVAEVYLFFRNSDQAQILLTEALLKLPQLSVSLQVRAHLLQLELAQVLGESQQQPKHLQQIQRLLPQLQNRLQRADTQLKLAKLALEPQQMAPKPLALTGLEHALTGFNEAFQLYQQLELPWQASQALYGQAEVLRLRGQHPAALKAYATALELLKSSKREYAIEEGFYAAGQGQSLLALGQYPEAIAALNHALNKYRNYSQIDALSSRSYFERLVPAFDALSQAYLRNGEPEYALGVLESRRALSFLRQIESGTQQTEDRGDLFFGQQSFYLRHYWEQLPAGTNTLIFGEPALPQLLTFSLKGLPAGIDPKLTYFNYLEERMTKEAYFAEAFTAQEITLSEAMAKSRYYASARQALNQPAAGPAPQLEELVMAYRDLLAQPQSDPQQLKALSQLLYELLISPHEALIASSPTLLIVPDGALGLLPFESLQDAEGRYLVEKVHIQYVQSLSVLQKLKQRSLSPQRKPMLALGNPIYEPIDYESDPISSAEGFFAVKRQLLTYPEQHTRELYGALYGAQWSPLPGTEAEIKGIAQTIPQTKLLEGEAVSESNIKAMSERAELQGYKVLHFAMHGLSSPEIPELSALVLSQFNELQPEDGYLRLPEIARLKLQADFVNLSACETGLGKVFRGEGVVGLSQAFLTAGAQQVSVSLWQIGDQSTAQLMQALYQQTQASHYSQTLSAIKRQFISGKFGKDYQHPYYWSPFVVYGTL